MRDNTWGDIIFMIFIVAVTALYVSLSDMQEVKEKCEGSHVLEIFGNIYTCVPNPRDPR